MDNLSLIDAVERYLQNEMSADERHHFDELRRTSPEVDQMVVEHHLFLDRADDFGRSRNFQHLLQRIHSRLSENGSLSDSPDLPIKTKVIQFWQRYRKTVAVAASIGGITALLISLSIQAFTPKTNKNYLQNLGRKINAIENRQIVQSQKINQLIDEDKLGPQVSGGSSFLVDGDGYLVTNYHVVNGASTVVVSNKGHDYVAKTVYIDAANDIALLKIDDEEWQSRGALPYGIRKSSADLGEEIFTLGYPRNEIVYNRGYLSASSGYNNDSLSVQLSISANPGNSGGPVMDRNGDIIGILSTRDRQANDVVFATKAVNINKAIEELKKDTSFNNLSIPSLSKASKNLDRVSQIKKIQDCVYMVKAY